MFLKPEKQEVLVHTLLKRHNETIKFYHLYLKIDQVMLAQMKGVKEVAYYAAAAKLSEFWYVFPILIANAYNAKLLETKNTSISCYQNFLTLLLSSLTAIAVLVSLVIYMLSEPLVDLIYGADFSSSSAILTIHIFSSVFIFQRAVASKWLIAEGLYKFSLFSTGAGAISNILLNYLLIPHYGGIGAAWASLISYMIASYLSFSVYRKTRPLMKLMTKAITQWPIVLLHIGKYR